MAGQKADQGAGKTAGPTLDKATIAAIAQSVAGQIEVQRDQGVQVRPGMHVRVRRAGPGACFYDAVELEPDRVFQLTGTRNDEKLVRLGYLEIFTGKALACRVCGGEFASERGREMHGRAKHEPKVARGVLEVPLDSKLHREKTVFSEEDVAHEQAVQAAVVRRSEQAEEATERKLDEEVPLYLDKTTASRK